MENLKFLTEQPHPKMLNGMKTGKFQKFWYPFGRNFISYLQLICPSDDEAAGE